MSDKKKLHVFLKNCSCCGNTHLSVELQCFTKAQHHGYTHWGICPSTGEPLLTNPTLKKDHSDHHKFFTWISKVCKELGWDISKGKHIIDDPNWYACYVDGLTPQEAVAECLNKLQE